MKNLIVFKTDNNYHYLYNMSTRRFSLIEEMTYKIFRLIENGATIDQVQKHSFIEKASSSQGGLPLSYYISKVKSYLSNMKTNWTPVVSANISTKKMRQEFFSNPQIVFEVTEKCNLACEYCAYGSYYVGYDKRENKHLSIKAAKNLIDFILNNKLVQSSQNITISFYGGEPLLNISFIHEIVEFSNSIKTNNQELNYSMTTNGTLLSNHIEYLVEHDFEVLISLDGNKENNSYRTFKNGSESFNKITENIDSIINKYPRYFEKNINFIAVLHNRNSVQDINKFIFTKYAKYPIISEIAADGVDDTKKDEFFKIYKNKFEDLLASKDYYSQLLQNNIEKTPEFDSAVYFINNLTELKVSEKIRINNLAEEKNFLFPTGTCIPFQRKIFITTNGKILPCESIDHTHSLGFLTDSKVDIDFVAIAEFHNNYLNRLSNQCKKCYRVTSCMECVYTMWFKGDSPICKNLASIQDFSNYLSKEMSYLETNKVIEKIIYETELD